MQIDGISGFVRPFLAHIPFVTDNNEYAMSERGFSHELRFHGQCHHGDLGTLPNPLLGAQAAGVGLGSAVGISK